MVEYDLKAIEHVLAEVKKVPGQTKELSLFSLGGRGYYENPASDLLAFFLNSNAGHGLGDLFLSAFLECLQQDYRQLDLHNLTIRREKRTKEQNRIDLLILGNNWCLLIENKVYHWQSNPFSEYECYAKELGKETRLFSILSPDGNTQEKGWHGVSYKAYCQLLRQRLGAKIFELPFSKWQLFAREFILHLENELYGHPMKPEQASFVEKHAVELIQAQSLLIHYSEYLCAHVKQVLEDRLRYEVEVKPDWAIIIKSPVRWGNAWIALRPPTESDRNDRTPGSPFDICIYPDGGSSKLRHASAAAGELLKEMRELPIHGCWVSNKVLNECSDALDFIFARINFIERDIAS